MSWVLGLWGGVRKRGVHRSKSPVLPTVTRIPAMPPEACHDFSSFSPAGGREAI
jgi:hypothetical protein